MSNSLAIAAVTATLRSLLERCIIADPAVDPSSDPDLSGTVVTARPPDEAAGRNHARQLNLFLYQTNPNAAWRNMDMPRQTRSGETGQPPLPLTLHYLLTAYIRDDNEDADFLSHRLLGRAMSILHDHPLLGEVEIRNALVGNDLDAQVERVRITPQTLNLDEMSKLWTTFQTPYRLSTAYEVSVVLIESNRSIRTPLPVLQRGNLDQGVFVTASPTPIITEIRLPAPKAAAELGDALKILGSNLDSASLALRFHHAQLDTQIELTPLPGGTSSTIEAQIPDITVDPNTPSQWPAGIYTVSVVVQRPNNLPVWTTNEVPFALSPRITITDPPARQAAQGDVSLTLTCLPQIWPKQRITLLFGDRVIPVATIETPPDPTAATTLTFLVRDALPGSYVLRLRVDGIDSLPIEFSSSASQFDALQKVTITK